MTIVEHVREAAESAAQLALSNPQYIDLAETLASALEEAEKLDREDPD